MKSFKKQAYQLVKKQLSKQLQFNSNNLTKINDFDLLEKLKQYLFLSDNYLTSEFKKGTNVRLLVQMRAQHIDAMLIALWQYLIDSKADTNQDVFNNQNNPYVLIAVGGYGRGELHPHSDIDLLILSENSFSDPEKVIIEKFISLLWDCKLKVSQAVRNYQDCLEIAKQELSVITSIMESRKLIGDQNLFDQLHQETSPKKIWQPELFFEAKIIEQKRRYRKYDDSSFDLEPNIKSSPGGLRDIQLINWIAQRIYFPKTLNQLIQQKLITKEEFKSLIKCQFFLWKIRFSLHLIAGKSEDRLLFDYQKDTALMMGFKNTKKSLAVEKMMKHYYQSVLIIRNITDILLQHLEQDLKSVKTQNFNLSIVPVDENFQIINYRIGLINPDGFLKNPSLLLKIFHYLALDKSLKGITVSTLRAIRAARHKVTPSFRRKIENKYLFIQFWHILHTAAGAMFAMKRSGILADYLLPFKQITGQMQYDMFHSYTVDEHTLLLLKNLSEFANPERNHEFPVCSEIMQRQKHPEIIFLAGLFHDIAKGRGGDHSELGAIEAKNFCLTHNLPSEHTEIIEWLVANHLLMSLIAQKRDISDPKVVNNFARLVTNPQRLELLYILTVADIRATSSKLWNSWKDTLLKELYKNTLHYLTQENSNLDDIWKINQQKSQKILIEKGYKEKDILLVWQHLHDSYFAKRSVKSICWQTEIILNADKSEETLVAIRPVSQDSGSEIFIYTKDQENLFATLTTTINRQCLSIEAANIFTTKDGYCYDSFYVLKDQGETPLNQEEIQKLQDSILYHIENIDQFDISVEKIIPRQFKYFSIPIKILFDTDQYNGLTRLELTAPDQPGLLAAVGKAFKITNTKLHDARVNTLGEKVEDTFIISDYNNQPINSENKRQQIREEIIRQLQE